MRLDDIDKNVEILGLSAADRTGQKELRDQLKRILQQEELSGYKDTRTNRLHMEMETLGITMPR